MKKKRLAAHLHAQTFPELPDFQLFNVSEEKANGKNDFMDGHREHY
jgi:hypothetical protein